MDGCSFSRKSEVSEESRFEIISKTIEKTDRTMASIVNKEKKYLVGLAVDCSGSMQPFVKELLKGISGFMINLAKDEDAGRIYLHLNLFNKRVKEVHSGSLKKFSMKNFSEQYKASGNTALYGTICSTLEKLEELNELHKFTKVSFSIYTDGEDTCSPSMQDSAREAVLKAKEWGWETNYLCAAEEHISAATNIGFDKEKIQCFKPEKIEASMSSLGNTLSLSFSQTLN